MWVECVNWGVKWLHLGRECQAWPGQSSFLSWEGSSMLGMCAPRDPLQPSSVHRKMYLRFHGFMVYDLWFMVSCFKAKKSFLNKFAPTILFLHLQKWFWAITPFLRLTMLMAQSHHLWKYLEYAILSTCTSSCS